MLATEKQKNYINTLLKDSNETALQKSEFLRQKGINNLTKKDAIYLINILKKYNKTSKSSTTSKKKTKHKPLKTGKIDYQGHANSATSWQGVNYKPHQEMKDIAKIIKKELKFLYPNHKFSITSDFKSLNISLMSGPHEVFKNYDLKNDNDYIELDRLTHLWSYGDTPQELIKQLEDYKKQGHAQLNTYHLKTDWRLNDKTIKLFEKVKDIAQSFNFDDSEVYTDYFHYNFTLSLNIASYNKPYQIK